MRFYGAADGICYSRGGIPVKFSIGIRDSPEASVKPARRAVQMGRRPSLQCARSERWHINSVVTRAQLCTGRDEVALYGHTGSDTHQPTYYFRT